MDRRDNNKKTIFAWAKDIGHTPILNFIYFQIILNSMPNGKITPGLTKLYFALECHQNLNEIIQLLENGSSPDEKYLKQKFGPIHIASREGDLEVVKYFIEKKLASLNETDNHGQTPLMYAAASGKISVLKWLLAQDGINLNASIKSAADAENGKTALHLASEYGEVEAVKLLLEAKADPMLESHAMKLLPIHLAARCGKVEIAQALIKAYPEGWDNQMITDKHLFFGRRHVDTSP